MIVLITDLITTSVRCRLEEQSGRIGKIRSDGNQGSITIQNGTIAVNQEKFIPRLTRSKTADQALQASDNLTLPTNKPCEGKPVLIPIGLIMEAVEPDDLIPENQKKLVSRMMRASIAGHSQKTCDNITDLATMFGKRKTEDLGGRNGKILLGLTKKGRDCRKSRKVYSKVDEVQNS
eukprot:6405960-Ditylum_brightwellii.AAC.1